MLAEAMVINRGEVYATVVVLPLLGPDPDNSRDARLDGRLTPLATLVSDPCSFREKLHEIQHMVRMHFILEPKADFKIILVQGCVCMFSNVGKVGCVS